MSKKKSKKTTGFVDSKHIFGDNELIRNGTNLYYLKWEWNPSKKFKDIIFITPSAYKDIKNLLLEVEHDDVYTVVNEEKAYRAATKVYRTTPENLEEIKQYLITNNILKE